MTLLDQATLQRRAPASYGLAVGKGNCVVPVGGLGNLIANNVSDGSSASTTYRTFHPLSDSRAGAVLPVWTNNPNPSNVSGDNAAPNAIIVGAALELSDGTVVPFTFNDGQHLVTIPAGGGYLAIPDAPITFGATITDPTFGPGVIVRTYVTTPLPTRVDTVGLTSGSNVVTDTSITAQDQGRRVTGTGIPSGSYVGTVTPGSQFLLSNRPDSQNGTVNATATNAAASASLLSIWPINYGAPTGSNGAFRTNGANGADLTVEGSPAGQSGFATNANCYGPAMVLGPAPSGRKPIVLCMSDSIFGGATDQFLGPVGRAAALLRLPHVRMSKVGETALGASTPAGRKYRGAAIPGCTHAIVEYGTNDGVTSAAQATNIQNYLTAIANYLATLGIKTWACTVPPKTTSTDAWATTANQTPLNNPTHLATLNSWIRAGGGGVLAGYIDLHDAVASGRDTGIWTPGATADGTHPATSAMTGPVLTAVTTVMAAWSYS